MATKNPRKDKDVKRRDLYTTADLEKIRIVEGLNVRKELGDIPELMDLIRASNRITPLLVRRNPDSEVEALWDLIGGHRRLEAAKRLMAEGWEGKLTIEEVTCTEEEMFLLMALDNMGRVDFSPVEEAEVVVRLARMGWTDQEISGRMGRSLPWVIERKALYTAAPEVKVAVKEGNLPADVATNIAKSGSNEKQREVLAKAEESAKQEAEESAKKGSKRRNWRKGMRKAVASQTGKKLVPGKKLLRQVKQEMADAIEGKVLNGSSKKVLLAFDFALGEITIEKFRDEMGYETEA